MAFIPATDVAELVIQQELAGQTVDNVLDFLYPSAISTTDLTDLGISVIANWVAHLAPLFAVPLNLIAAKATDLTTSSSPSEIVSASVGVHGTATGPPTSNNVALVLSERTELRGRSYRGRVYSAGLPSEERSDASNMSADYVAGFIAGWAAFFLAVEADTGSQHSVLSRFNAGAPRVSGVATDIISLSCNRQLDSQRRRLDGRGT